MKCLHYTMKELERHCSPKEKTNWKRADERQIVPKVERGLAGTGQMAEPVGPCQQIQLHVPVTFSFTSWTNQNHVHELPLILGSCISQSSSLLFFPSPLLWNPWKQVWRDFHGTLLRAASGSFLYMFHWFVMLERVFWFHLFVCTNKN